MGSLLSKKRAIIYLMPLRRFPWLYSFVKEEEHTEMGNTRGLFNLPCALMHILQQIVSWMHPYLRTLSSFGLFFLHKVELFMGFSCGTYQIWYGNLVKRTDYCQVCKNKFKLFVFTQQFLLKLIYLAYLNHHHHHYSHHNIAGFTSNNNSCFML